MLKKYIDELIEKDIKDVVIDVDNTITKSNVLDLLFFIKANSLHTILYYLWVSLFFILKGPLYGILDFVNRDWFQKAFYGNYSNYPLKELEDYSKELFARKLQSKFITEIHDLIFYLKRKNMKVHLLSTSIEPVVKQYGDYFGVPFTSLRVIEQGDGSRVDLASIKDFKLNYIKTYNPHTTIAIADSKHDFNMLNYVDHPIVVSSKEKRWMKKLQNKPFLFIVTISNK